MGRRGSVRSGIAGAYSHAGRRAARYAQILRVLGSGPAVAGRPFKELRCSGLPPPMPAAPSHLEPIRLAGALPREIAASSAMLWKPSPNLASYFDSVSP